MVIFTGTRVSASSLKHTTQTVRTRSSRLRICDLRMSRASLATLAIAGLAGWASASAQISATPQFAAAPSTPQVLCQTQVIGNRRIPKESVLARLFSRPGDPYDGATVERDFNSLWNTGYFDDLRIERVDEPTCVQLIVYVKEKPTIRAIRYTGLNAITESDVLERFKKEKVSLSVESQYNPTNIKRAETVLKEMEGEHGHQFATVKAEIKTIPPAAVELTFNVKEGPTVKVGKIVFSGNEHLGNRELITAMVNSKPIGIPHSIFLENIFPRTFDASKLDEDAERVRQAYRNKGYFTAITGEPETNVRNAGGINPFTLRPSTGKRVDILIPIEEGERYKLAAITFSGYKQLNNIKAFRAQFQMKDGEYFNATAFSKGLDNLKKAYGSQGYINMVGTPEPKVDKANKVVTLNIDIDEGKKFYISRIEFSGNSITRDRVIRRELMIEEGQPYNSQMVDYSLLRLNQLSYFEVLKADQDVETRQNTDAGTVDVLIKLREKGKNSIGLNGGVSGQSGSFLGLNYETNNFLGFGETLSVNANIGDLSRQLSFGFNEPYLRNKPVSLGVQVFDRKSDFNPAKSYSITNGQSANLTNAQQSLLNNYNESSKGFVLSTSTPLRRFLRHSGVARVGLSYSLTRSGITTFNQNTLNVFQTLAFRTGIAGQNQLSGIITSVLIPSFSLSTLDRGQGAHSGHDLTVSMQVAGVGGNTKFVQPTVSYRQFFPMHLLKYSKEGHNVLGYRVQFSNIEGFGGEVAPPFNRIYAGGENDLRGFDIRSASPYTFIPTRVMFNLTNPDGTIVPRDPTNGVFGNVQIPLPVYRLASVGADTALTTNLEYRIPIVSQATIAFFSDFGLVGNLEPSQLRQSVLGQSFLNAPSYGCPAVINGACSGGYQENFPLHFQTVPGTNWVPRMSDGVSLQVTLPIINAPFQIYYAYNPLRLYKDLPQNIVLPPPCAASATTQSKVQQCFQQFFPLSTNVGAAQFSAGQAYQYYGADYILREPRKTFRFTVATSF